MFRDELTGSFETIAAEGTGTPRRRKNENKQIIQTLVSIWGQINQHLRKSEKDQQKDLGTPNYSRFLAEYGGRISHLGPSHVSYALKQLDMNEDGSAFAVIEATNIASRGAKDPVKVKKWQGVRTPVVEYGIEGFEFMKVVIQGLDKAIDSGTTNLEALEYHITLPTNYVYALLGISPNTENKQELVEQWKLASVLASWAESKMRGITAFRDPQDFRDRDENQPTNITVRLTNGNLLYLPDIDLREEIIEEMKDCFDPDTNKFDTVRMELGKDIVYWNIQQGKLMYAGDRGLVIFPIVGAKELSDGGKVKYIRDTLIGDIVNTSKDKNGSMSWSNSVWPDFSINFLAACQDANLDVNQLTTTFPNTPNELIAKFRNIYGGNAKSKLERLAKTLKNPSHGSRTARINTLKRYSLAGLVQTMADVCDNFDELVQKWDDRVAAVKNASSADLKPLPANLRSGISLFPHQADVMAVRQVCVEQGIKSGVNSIATGGGKTLMFLLDLMFRIGEGDIKKPIGIMPAGLLPNFWNDIRKFCGKNMNVFILSSETAGMYGMDGLKEAALKMPPNTIFLTSYTFLYADNVEDMVGKKKVHYYPNVDYLLSMGFDYVFIDESHAIKENKTKTAEATIAFAHRMNENVCIGTGTLMPNKPIDATGQFAAIDPAIFGDSSQFKKEFTRGKGAQVNEERSPEYENRLFYLGGVIKTRKDWFYMLPKIDENVHTVKLSAKQRAFYDALVANELEIIKEQFPNIEDLIDGWVADEGETGLSQALIGRLSRIEAFSSDPAASEYAQLDVEGTPPLHGEDADSPKIPKIIELIEDHFRKTPDEKLLVFSAHRSRVIGNVLKALPSKYKDQAVLFYGGRKRALEQFKYDDNKKIMVGCYKALREGHNLQVASRMIMLDVPWTPGDLDQVLARVYRPSGTDMHLAYELEDLEKDEMKALIGRQVRTIDNTEGSLKGIQGSDGRFKAKIILESGEEQTLSAEDVWIKQDQREFVHIDWVLADSTIDMVKLQRTVRGMVRNALLQKIIPPGSIEQQLPPIVNIETLLEGRAFEDITMDVRDYVRFRELEQEQWDIIQQSSDTATDFVPIEISEPIPGSKEVRTPLVYGCDISEDAVYPADKYIQDKSIDDLKDNYVETQFGKGIVSGVGVKKEWGYSVSVTYDDGVERNNVPIGLVDVLEERTVSKTTTPVINEPGEVVSIAGEWYFLTPEGILYKTKKTRKGAYKRGEPWLVLSKEAGGWLYASENPVKSDVSDELLLKLTKIYGNMGHDVSEILEAYEKDDEPVSQEDDTDIGIKPITIDSTKYWLTATGLIVPQGYKKKGNKYFFKKEKYFFEGFKRTWHIQRNGNPAPFTDAQVIRYEKFLKELGYKFPKKDAPPIKVPKPKQPVIKIPKPAKIRSNIFKMDLTIGGRKRKRGLVLNASGELFVSDKDGAFNFKKPMIKRNNGVWKIPKTAPKELLHPKLPQFLDKKYDKLQQEYQAEVEKAEKMAKKPQAPKQGTPKGEQVAKQAAAKGYKFSYQTPSGKEHQRILMPNGEIFEYKEDDEVAGKKKAYFKDGEIFTPSGRAVGFPKKLVNELKAKLNEMASGVSSGGKSQKVHKAKDKVAKPKEEAPSASIFAANVAGLNGFVVKYGDFPKEVHLAIKKFKPIRLQGYIYTVPKTDQKLSYMFDQLKSGGIKTKKDNLQYVYKVLQHFKKPINALEVAKEGSSLFREFITKGETNSKSIMILPVVSHDQILLIFTAKTSQTLSKSRQVFQALKVPYGGLYYKTYTAKGKIKNAASTWSDALRSGGIEVTNLDQFKKQIEKIK